LSSKSSIGIDAVVVKGGSAANTFYFDEAFSGGPLYAPINPSGGPAGVSNVRFCYDPDPAAAEWCSPGYWRQEHHLDSWIATGYSPTDSYNTIFGTTLAGNPSLLTVLQNPKIYASIGAFNNVGDRLSDAHPDVNYTGVRVEGEGHCPLN